MNYFKDKNNKVFAYDDEQVAQEYGKGLTSITKAEVDRLLAPTLAELKASKTSEINSACAKEITSGFTSSALGTPHIYQSEQTDQLNLIGVVTAGQDDYFKCGVTDANGNITWNYALHTIAQLQQVLGDGKVHKLALLKKANTLKMQVVSAKTVADVTKVVW